MFNFLNKLKKTQNQNTLPLEYTTDLHSHLLPGIDDGVKTLEESIDIIIGLKELGFKKIISTPHIMWHRFPNTRDTILDAYKKVKDELTKQNIDIEFEVAAEYYYDENFFELIEKEDLLSIGKDKYVLFELSYTQKPFGLEQTIFNILSKGYKPILAHPERYSYFAKDFEKYDKLKDSGVRFQINLNSLIGFYGKRPKKAVKYLIEKGLVDFVGSDIHSQKYLDSFSKAIYTKTAQNIFETNKIKNYTL